MNSLLVFTEIWLTFFTETFAKLLQVKLLLSNANQLHLKLVSVANVNILAKKNLTETKKVNGKSLFDLVQKFNTKDNCLRLILVNYLEA